LVFDLDFRLERLCDRREFLVGFFLLFFFVFFFTDCADFSGFGDLAFRESFDLSTDTSFTVIDDMTGGCS
jgi:hypothetical protein